jgi:hypothetical protein
MSDSTPGHGGKDFGENVLFANLSEQYKVYAFYYPGDVTDPDLEDALRTLADSAGKNLFVNIGRLNDPQLDKIAGRFKIKQYPVVIVTADQTLASAEGEAASAYVRLDNRRLFRPPYRVVGCVRELFNLFLQGKVAEAVAHAKNDRRAEKVREIGEFLGAALKPIAEFLGHLEISFSLAEGKITVKATKGAGG